MWLGGDHLEITEKDVEYVAKLSRIKFDPDEIKQFTYDFKNIIEYIYKLNELDTEGVDARSEVFDNLNVFREDEVEDSMPQEDVVRNSPTHDDKYILVPNVVE